MSGRGWNGSSFSSLLISYLAAFRIWHSVPQSTKHVSDYFFWLNSQYLSSGVTLSAHNSHVLLASCSLSQLGWVQETGVRPVGSEQKQSQPLTRLAFFTTLLSWRAKGSDDSTARGPIVGLFCSEESPQENLDPPQTRRWARNKPLLCGDTDIPAFVCCCKPAITMIV